MRIDVVRLEVIKDRSIDYGRRQLNTPEELADVGFKLLGKADREITLLICLSAINCINALHVVSIGSLNSSLLHPREVFKAAILTNSANIALLHNHPSGNLEPSSADIEVTEQMIEVGRLMGITLLDHVIIGDEAFYSFLNHRTCEFN